MRGQVMAFTVKGVVDGLDSFTGKKISGTTQPNITMDDFQRIIDDAMELALMKAHDMKLRRTGNPSKAVDHPGYEPIIHEPVDDLPFEVVTDGIVDFKTDDVVDILKHRKRVEENCKRREKVVKSVLWWRVGKPPNVIREELMREEARKVAEAKRLELPIPKSVFGTDEEMEALKVIENDRRQELKVKLEENPSGVVNLMWPEEHETWYNQMLAHELRRFEVAVLRMDYSVSMGLKVGKDGKIAPRGKMRHCCTIWR
jgi:hypothetical protein